MGIHAFFDYLVLVFERVERGDIFVGGHDGHCVWQVGGQVNLKVKLPAWDCQAGRSYSRAAEGF